MSWWNLIQLQRQSQPPWTWMPLDMPRTWWTPVELPEYHTSVKISGKNMAKTMKHIGNGAGDMTCETSCFNTWPTFIVRLGHSQPEKLSNFKQIPLLQFPCDRGGMSCHMRSLPSIYSKTGDHVFKWSSNHSSRENWKLIHDQSVNRREAATFWVRCLCPAYGNKAGYKGKFMAWHRDLPWSLTRSEWNLGPWACQRTMFNSLYI